MNIIIINGPNLNLLGKREKDIYGYQDFESYFEEMKSGHPQLELEYFQSNHEGAIIDKIQEAGICHNGIIINPAAYSHYSYAIMDALKAVDTPAMEVHISDIHNREEFRKTSVTAPACIGVISGMGLEGYTIALEHLINHIHGL